MITVKQIAGGEAFPVGSIFMSAVSTSPATLLGYGIWVTFASGRILVSRDAGDPDFDTVLEAGGSKTANHSHVPGSLSAGNHTGLSINDHGTHSHPLGSSMTTGPHQGMIVAAHVWSADMEHGHNPGSFWLSPHTDTGYVNRHLRTSLGTHTHVHTENVEISSHANYGVNDHPYHVHTYDAAPAHTHTLAAGWGAHQHQQRGMNSGAGTQAGTVITAPVYGPQVTSNNTSSSAITSGSVAVPPPSPSYTSWSTGNTNSDTRTHTPTGTAADHYSTSATPITEPQYAVATALIVAGIPHTLEQQLDNHYFTGTLGNAIDDAPSFPHAVTQPSTHTMSGTTHSDTGRTHSISAVDAPHTFSNATSSTIISIVPPYAVVYMWQRTA